MSIMLIFIALSIGLLILKSTWSSELTKNCTLKAGLSYQIDMVYKQGAQMLCTPACKCNADPLKWSNDTRGGMTTDRLGVSSITECPMDFLNTYQREKIVPVMTALETQFQCAGICEDPRYFLFSKVSQGPPNNNCRDEMQDYLAQNVKVYAGFLMAVGIMGFISFGMSFSISYMAKKSFKPETALFKFQKIGKGL